MFVSVTSDGTAYGRFRRALRMGNLAQVRAAAAELPQVGLDDALAVVLLMDARDDERYVPAWHVTRGHASVSVARGGWLRVRVSRPGRVELRIDL